MIKVFVYGTLLKGNSRAHVLKDSILLGTDELEGFVMYDLGQYPGIIAKEGYSIKGEVYQINKVVLKELDIIESVGQLYNRMTVNLKSGTQAFTYVYRNSVKGFDEIKIEDQPYKG